MFSPSLSLGALYWSALEQFSTEIAVVEGEKQISYAELKVAVERTAAIFSENGLTPGKRVGLAMGMSTDFVVTYLAAQVVGITVVELNPMLDNAMLSHRISVAKVDQVWFKPSHLSDDTLDYLAHLSCPLVDVEANDQASDFSIQDGLRAVATDEPAAINFTSGSTGMPKGIAMSSTAIATQVLLALSSVNHPSTPVCVLTMTHPTVMHMLMSPTLLRGGKVIVINNGDLKSTVDAAIEHRANFLFFPTRVLYLLLDEQPTDWMKKQVELCYYGGENMTDERLKEALDRCGQVFVQAYGMAETSPVALLKPEDHDLSQPQRLQSIGRPMVGCGIEIRSESGDVLPFNHPGKMFLHTPCAMDGYVGLPEKTAETLVSGWVDTGDVGFKDEQGFVYMLDREKFRFTINDRVLYPRMVEMCLSKHAAVAAVVACGLTVSGETRLCIAVQIKAGGEMSRDVVSTMIYSDFNVDVYQVSFVDAMPLHPVSRKIDREQLAQLFLVDSSGELSIC